MVINMNTDGDSFLTQHYINYCFLLVTTTVVIPFCNLLHCLLKLCFDLLL